MDCTPKNLRDHIPTVYVCQSPPKDPDQPEGGCTRLFEDVGAGAEEFEEAEVAQDLELLAGFVADGAKGRGKGQKPRPLNRRLRHPAICPKSVGSTLAKFLQTLVTSSNLSSVHIERDRFLGP